eukprot:CAMPEP_0113700988 /NCGR_PEP_ID=MMETSP0038_2-20120614/24300_1 /TAXON_ID=2898 /ORGANISM="Cryptomonas paramecium" /LENGTH=82 /DNA_ID=CAMNT_0000624781 /DNA_START=145 /DNA_END=393 /DNA_ORIENTATION=+ /assembly_acc=CAM_ASM_000170
MSSIDVSGIVGPDATFATPISVVNDEDARRCGEDASSECEAIAMLAKLHLAHVRPIQMSRMALGLTPYARARMTAEAWLLSL